jgi:hypothetical protein
MEVDVEPESVEAGIGPEHYINDAHLPRILALAEGGDAARRDKTNPT